MKSHCQSDHILNYGGTNKIA